ncbi:MAG: alpha/beta hydrolase family protein [Asticcacaulis sp.]
MKNRLKSIITLAAGLFVLAGGPVFAQEATGTWAGKLRVPGAELRVIVEVQKAADGSLSGTLQSPDQSPQKLPLTTIAVKDGVMTFTLDAFKIAYEGRWDAVRKTWVGTTTQAGAPLPLDLEAASPTNTAAPAKPKRPQVDAIEATPRPYTERALSFVNPDAPGVSLAGVFSAPKGKGPFPAVLLVSGSGPHTRDETVADHKIFLVLRDHLTRQGFAVLSYDKRGVGESKGVYDSATSYDFASDAVAALAALKQQPEVNPRKLGLIGHSEGGLIGPVVASRIQDLAYMVLMAGPGIPGDALLAEQSARIAEASGLPAGQVPVLQQFQYRLYQAVHQSKTEAEFRDRMIALRNAPGAPPIADSQIDGIVDQLYTPWMRAFLAHDPAPSLKAVTMPVLVLNGDKDLQVLADSNIGGMRKGLTHNPKARFVVLKDHNHLFQRAKTGLPQEYGKIEETLSPEFLQTLTEWLKSQ